MPKQKSDRERLKNGVNGKSVSKEMSIYRSLKEMIGTDTKVYYIMYSNFPHQKWDLLLEKSIL